mgnify:FL=1
MRFCKNCENMYYLKITEDNDNKLIYYCRNCGDQDTNIEDSCIISTQIKTSTQEYTKTINKYTKTDPTLPRTNTIKCPNSKCNIDSGENEIIYIKNDEQNINFIYMCSKCDTVWKTTNSN